jgi:hypothetical protein
MNHNISNYFKMTSNLNDLKSVLVPYTDSDESDLNETASNSTIQEPKNETKKYVYINRPLLSTKSLLFLLGLKYLFQRL